jgi:hypothetical protein
MAAGGKDGNAPANGLSVFDMEQAEKQFAKGTGTKLGDSVNEAKAAKKARDDRKKYQKAQRDKRETAIKSVREKEKTNPTKELKEIGGGDRGMKDGGLASKKKK